jgi:methylmalonyl-CoA epimerase
VPSGPSLDHVGIAVRDLNAARGIYEALGTGMARRELILDEQVEVLMLPLADGTRLELLQPTVADSPVGRFLARRGEGLHHVALRVPDLEAAIASARQAGARLLSDEPRIGAGGHRYVFVHPASAAGVLLELLETPDMEHEHE